MTQTYNGYGNYETWNFNLHYGDMILEVLEEEQACGQEVTRARMIEVLDNTLEELDEQIETIDNNLLRTNAYGNIRLILVDELAEMYWSHFE